MTPHTRASAIASCTKKYWSWRGRERGRGGREGKGGGKERKKETVKGKEDWVRGEGSEERKEEWGKNLVQITLPLLSLSFSLSLEPSQLTSVCIIKFLWCRSSVTNPYISKYSSLLRTFDSMLSMTIKVPVLPTPALQCTTMGPVSARLGS